MTVCNSCGTPTPPGSRFCPACGAAVSAPDTSTPAEDASWVALAGEPAPPQAPPPAAPIAAPTFTEAPVAAAPLNPTDNVPAHSGPPVETSARFDDAPTPSGRSKAMWLAVTLIGIVGAIAIVGWALDWTRTATRTELVAEEGTDDPAPPGAPAWQAAYVDSYVGTDSVDLVTGGEARQRDFPTTEGSAIIATLPAGSRVSGRWVRGRDATTKWLKLAGGGYVWEGNLAQPGGARSAIEVGITNRRARFGADIDEYLDQIGRLQRAEYARVERLDPKERTAAMDRMETASTYVRVPARRWQGVTVVAVGQHYESQGVVFREDVAAVRRALVQAGVQVNDDGVIPLPDDEIGGCSVSSTAEWPEARAYGASSIECGV